MGRGATLGIPYLEFSIGQVASFKCLKAVSLLENSPEHKPHRYCVHSKWISLMCLIRFCRWSIWVHGAYPHLTGLRTSEEVWAPRCFEYLRPLGTTCSKQPLKPHVRRPGLPFCGKILIAEGSRWGYKSKSLSLNTPIFRARRPCAGASVTAGTRVGASGNFLRTIYRSAHKNKK